MEGKGSEESQRNSLIRIEKRREIQQEIYEEISSDKDKNKIKRNEK
jgi:hypothetical protein